MTEGLCAVENIGPKGDPPTVAFVLSNVCFKGKRVGVNNPDGNYESGLPFAYPFVHSRSEWFLRARKPPIV